MIKITKYRTIAIIYPHLSFEVEVVKDDRKLYVNADVNSRHELERAEGWKQNGEFWVYEHPLDKATDEDFDGAACRCLTENEVDFILKQMEEKWNSDPVFTKEGTWKNWM